MVEFVKVTKDTSIDASETKDWYAWLDMMPPSPNNFHVSGSVLAPNPGVSATLEPTTPQGFNPKILFLDLVLDQQAGYWPQVMTWVSARYDKVTEGNPYESVQIFHEGQPIGGADVEIVS